MTGRGSRFGWFAMTPTRFTGDDAEHGVAVAPSGRFVYGCNRGCDGIAIFAVEIFSRSLVRSYARSKMRLRGRVRQYGAYRARKPRRPLRQSAGDCPAPSTPLGYASDGPSVLNPGVHSVDIEGAKTGSPVCITPVGG
jgi:hypothetical protein